MTLDTKPIADLEQGVATLLMVPNAEAAERIVVTLSDRYASHETRIEIFAAASPDVVRETRRRIGGAPLGVVVLDEVAALETLAQGADEILLWPPASDRTIHGFFDRTQLRASLRRAQERTSTEIAHAEKLSALGTLVAGVAHEINNPLMALQLSIEACMQQVTPATALGQELKQWVEYGSGATPEQIERLYLLSQTSAPRVEGRQLLEEMLTASASIANVVRDLRIFARSDDGREEAQLLSVHEVIDQALRLVGREMASLAHIERDYARVLPGVLAPQGRLSQVLVNIFINATHAMHEIERQVHRVRISTRADGEFVAISVSDTGAGIAPDVLSHIFDPFFTTKRTGLGTGLGLSISRSIVRGLGGDLIVESVHGSGATFIILLPQAAKDDLRPAVHRQRGTTAQAALVERPTVLVVDDDERVLKAYARVLASSCDVLMANDGQEAIDLLSSGSKADALVTELSLPEVDGPSLFAWVKRERPALADCTVFVAAEATRERYRAFLEEEAGTPSLTKPITAQKLWSTLRGMIRPELPHRRTPRRA